jgi:hypothetical protein
MEDMVTLRGNTHPLARPEYDQGAALPAWFQLGSIEITPLFSNIFLLLAPNCMCFQQHSSFVPEFSTAVPCFQ